MSKTALKGLALAAGLTLTALATPASAAYVVHLNSSSMNQTYTANINYSGVGGSVNVTAYSNGITFNVTNTTGPNAGATENLFAFCIDIFHHMSIGGLNDFYISTYGDTPNPSLYDGSGSGALSPTKTNEITTLADIGFLLNRDAPGAETALKTAAIQAAIWEIEHPGSVTLNNGGAVATLGGTTYQQYFEYYRDLNGAGSRIFTLTDTVYGTDVENSHQGFVVGWPPEGGVPEPATWALMLSGFFGAGHVIRRRRAALA